MKYIRPEAKVVEFAVSSIILASEVFCVIDAYNGGDLWEDDTNAKKGVPDFYSDF